MKAPTTPGHEMIAEPPPTVEEAAAAGLLAMMYGLSQEFWSAQWIDGLERILWRLCQKASDRTSSGVSDGDIDLLLALHRRAGGWWSWSGNEDGPVFLMTADWVRQFERKA